MQKTNQDQNSGERKELLRAEETPSLWTMKFGEGFGDGMDLQSLPPASRTVRNKYLLSKQPNLWYFVIVPGLKTVFV